MNFKEKAEEKILGWKTTVEELQLQLSLGKAEASDELEKQKSNFKSFINESKEKAFAFTEKINPEKTKELKIKFEELQLQLALGKAETKDAFEEQKEKINQGLDSIYQLLKTGLDKASKDEKINTFVENFESTVDNFKTKLEASKLQFALGKADAKDEIEKNKNEVLEKLNDIRAKLESNKEVAEEKWDGFKTEMSDAFSHIKNAFKKL